MFAKWYCIWVVMFYHNLSDLGCELYFSGTFPTTWCRVRRKGSIATFWKTLNYLCVCWLLEFFDIFWLQNKSKVFVKYGERFRTVDILFSFFSFQYKCFKLISISTSLLLTPLWTPHQNAVDVFSLTSVLDKTMETTWKCDLYISTVSNQPILLFSHFVNTGHTVCLPEISS